MHSTKYSLLGCCAAHRNPQKNKEHILALEGLFSKPAAIIVANMDLLFHGERMPLGTGQSSAAACLQDCPKYSKCSSAWETFARTLHTIP